MAEERRYAAWTVSGCGLNTSVSVDINQEALANLHFLEKRSGRMILGTYTPTLSNLSCIGVLKVLRFEDGFELRCFQLLSDAAWLPSSALPDNW